jgi:hypothetical protein
VFLETYCLRTSNYLIPDFYRPRQSSPDLETSEEYQARIRRAREEQAAAAKRRAEEAARRKVRQEQEREGGETVYLRQHCID